MRCNLLFTYVKVKCLVDLEHTWERNARSAQQKHESNMQPNALAHVTLATHGQTTQVEWSCI